MTQTVTLHPMTDLTHGRSHMEAARQRALLQAIADHVPIMVYIVDPLWKVQWINREWERVLGWSLEEAQRVDFFAAAYPDPEYRAEAMRLLRHARRWVDLHLRRKDGLVVTTSWATVHLSDGSIIGIGQDITERKQAEEALHASQEQLRRLSAHVAASVERERTDLARELHDQLGQMLTALKMDAVQLRERLPRADGSAALAGKVTDMVATIDHVIRMVRRIAAGLRPIALDRLGLLAAIEWQSEDFERRSGVRCRFESRVTALDIETAAATQVFRIVQEALTNAMRHAQASRVTVSVKKQRGAARVDIHDNGHGISDAALADPGALGLVSMRERALLAGGSVSIARAGRKGTIVRVSVPLRTRTRRDQSVRSVVSGPTRAARRAGK